MPDICNCPECNGWPEYPDEDLTSVFTDPAPVDLPAACGVLDQCECGMCETAHAEYLASEAAAL